MKTNFLQDFRRFLIVYGHGQTTKVKCLKCREWCEMIDLPQFTMYFCTSIYCTNVLELRHIKKNRSWKVHQYGDAVKDLTITNAQAKKLLQKPQDTEL